MHHVPSHLLQTLRKDLEGLRSDRLSVHEFSHNARQPAALLAALPARYAEVWHNLLDRLESGALFTEESCSFSQTDLLDSLALWLNKAEAQLNQRNA